MINRIYDQPDRQSREECAYIDCRGYLMDDWNDVLEVLRDCWADSAVRASQRYRLIRGALAVIGIRGRYPVRAMVRCALAGR